jgi:hypothetical protein
LGHVSKPAPAFAPVEKQTKQKAKNEKQKKNKQEREKGL